MISVAICCVLLVTCAISRLLFTSQLLLQDGNVATALAIFLLGYPVVNVDTLDLLIGGGIWVVLGFRCDCLDDEVTPVLQYVIIVSLPWRRKFQKSKCFLRAFPELLDHEFALVLRVRQVRLLRSLLHVLVVLRVHECVRDGALHESLLLDLFQQLRMALSSRTLELLVHFQIADVVAELFSPLGLHEGAALPLGLRAVDLFGDIGQVLVVILWEAGLGSLDVDLQLVQEIGPYLEVRPARIDELERLQKRPLELLHEVQNGNDRGTALATDRVDQHARTLIYGLVDEPHDFLRHSVLLVENQLPVVV